MLENARQISRFQLNLTLLYGRVGLLVNLDS